MASDPAIQSWRRERLARARLYFVCEAQPGAAGAAPVLAAALEGGVDILQLRESELGGGALVNAAAGFRGAAEEAGALFILNDRPDLVEECRADGVHVGQDDAPVSDARRQAGTAALVGLSTHSEAQIEAACAAKADARPDYISVGPVWETPTKPGRPSVGLELVEIAARIATLPFFAIGGIEPGNAASVVASGARRLAVVRAIRDAEDPAIAARALREALAAPDPARA